jgi:hypothetical protein
MNRAGYRGRRFEPDGVDHSVSRCQQQRGGGGRSQDRPSGRHAADGILARRDGRSRLAGPADLRFGQKQAEQGTLGMAAPAVHLRPPEPRFGVADTLCHPFRNPTAVSHKFANGYKGRGLGVCLFSALRPTHLRLLPSLEACPVILP